MMEVNSGRTGRYQEIGIVAAESAAGPKGDPGVEERKEQSPARQAEALPLSPPAVLAGPSKTA